MRRWLGAALGVGALGAGGVASADPVPSAALGPAPSPTRLELRLVPIKPIRFSFSTASPGVEMLRLPTFDFDTTWYEAGRFSVHTFSRVAVAPEVDCSLTCQPVLERSLGVEPRLELGNVGPRVPAVWFSARPQLTQLTSTNPGTAARPVTSKRVFVGLSGLLDL